MIKKMISRIHRVAFLAVIACGLALAPACKKAQDAAPRSSGTPSDILPMPSNRSKAAPVAPAPASSRDARMERALDQRYGGDESSKSAMRQTMTELDALGSAEKKLMETRRRTMVTPAPPGFRPEAAGRKVKLKLILESDKVRAGSYPRFRLELSNVGNAPLDYSESSPSLFSVGTTILNSPTISFYLVKRNGRRVKLTGPTFPVRRIVGGNTRAGIHPPDGLSEPEMERWFVETNAMGRARSTFEIRLAPGETLRSLGDSPNQEFKTLYTDVDFDAPGAYRLQAVLDDRPKPRNQIYIDAMLRSGSTREEIERDFAQDMQDALGPVKSVAIPLEVTH